MDEIKKEEVMAEPMATPETKVEKPLDRKPKADKKATDKFIKRKLTVINTMTNPAKARRAAERVLENKRKAVK